MFSEIKQVITGRPNSGSCQCLDCATFGLHQLIVYGSGSSVFMYSGAFDFVGNFQVPSGGNDVTALAICEQKAMLAVSSGSLFWVYQLETAPFSSSDERGYKKLRLSSRLVFSKDVSYHITCLSWSTKSYLAVGGICLSLYKVSTNEAGGEMAFICQRRLAQPLEELQFSTNGTCIASRGKHDSLAKIWFTLQSQISGTSLDFLYLRHPKTVLHFSWRKRSYSARKDKDILMTLSADNVTRFWLEQSKGPRLVFTLCAVVDPTMYATILPTSESLCTNLCNFGSLNAKLEFSQSASSLESLEDIATPPSTDTADAQVARKWCVLHWMNGNQIASALHDRAEAENKYLSQLPDHEKQLRSSEQLKHSLQADGEYVYHVAADGSLILWSLAPIAAAESPSAANGSYEVFLLLRQVNALLPSDAQYFASGSVFLYHDRSFRALYGQSPVLLPPELNLVGMNTFGQINMYQLNVEDVLHSAMQLQHHHVRLCASQTGHKMPLDAVYVHCSLPLVATCGSGGLCAVWRVDEPQIQVRRVHLIDPIVVIDLHDVTRNMNPISCVAWVPNEPQILVARSDRLEMYTIDSDACRKRFVSSFSYSERLDFLHCYPDVLNGQPNSYVAIGLNKQSNTFAVFSVTRSAISLVSTAKFDSATSIRHVSAYDDLRSSFLPYCELNEGLLFTVDSENAVWFHQLLLDDELKFSSRKGLSIDSGKYTIEQVAAGLFGKIAFSLRDLSKGSQTVQIWGCSPVGTGFELESEFTCDERVQSLSWYFTSDAQHMLAVAFATTVSVYTQTVSEASELWTCLCAMDSIDIEHIQLVSWLPNGGLLVSGETILVVLDKWSAPPPCVTDSPGITIDAYSGFLGPNLLTLATAQNSRLPQYHPEQLLHYICWGHIELVKIILCIVSRYVYELSSHGHGIYSMPLSVLQLGLTKLSKVTDDGPRPAQSADYSALFDDSIQDDSIELEAAPPAAGLSEIDSSAIFGILQEYPSKAGKVSAAEFSSYATFLVDKLEGGLSLPKITEAQQQKLCDLIKLLQNLGPDFDQFDINGQRFWFALKLLPPRSMDTPVSANVWALHSESQAALLAAIPKYSDRTYCWCDLRRAGVGFWLRQSTLWPVLIEVAARNQYMGLHLPEYGRLAAEGRDLRDPLHCTLFYLALGRKSVVVKLWETANGQAEQQQMVTFLKKDFSDERWRTAAAKNAFVLLGKQRFELAAAFFLLAEKLKDCVSVCLKQLNDPQLALVVALLVEKSSSGEVYQWAAKSLLSTAVSSQDLWMQHLCYSLLSDHENAVRCFLTPLNTVSYDPLMLIVYLELLQTNASNRRLELVRQVSKSADEHGFVVAIMRAYERMGLFSLALDVASEHLSWGPEHAVSGVSVNHLKSYKWTLLMHIVQSTLRSSELVSIYNDILEQSVFFAGYFERIKARLLELCAVFELPVPLCNRLLLRRAVEASKLLGLIELLPANEIQSEAWIQSCTDFLRVESNTLCRLVLKPYCELFLCRSMTTHARNMIWALVRWQAKTAGCSMWDCSKSDQWSPARVAFVQSGLATWSVLIVCQLQLDGFNVVHFFVSQSASFFSCLFGGNFEQFGGVVRDMLRGNVENRPVSHQDEHSEADLCVAGLFLKMITVQYVFLQMNILLAKLTDVAHGQIYLFILEGILKQLPGVHSFYERQIESLWASTTFEGVQSMRECLLDTNQRNLWDYIVAKDNPFDVYNRILVSIGNKKQ